MLLHPQNPVKPRGRLPGSKLDRWTRLLAGSGLHLLSGGFLPQHCQHLATSDQGLLPPSCYIFTGLACPGEDFDQSERAVCACAHSSLIRQTVMVWHRL